MTENENALTAPQSVTLDTTHTASDLGQRRSVDFDGPRKRLFWLLARNFLLTIVTLGICRFWAKTRVRKYV
jgi:uncharacterized membrane protein YjgN (DUF898 family)